MTTRNTTDESQIGSNTRMTASMAANSTPGIHFKLFPSFDI